MYRRHPLPALLFVLFAATGVSASAADDKKIIKSLQDRLQKVQQAQRETQEEKDQLSVSIEAQKSDAARQLSALRAEVDRLRAATRRDAAALQELEGARAEVDRQRERLGELERELDAVRQSLKKLEQANADQRRDLDEGRGELDKKSRSLVSCEAQNQNLVELNADLLERFGRTAGSGGLLAPFEKVRVENEITACRDRNDEMKVSSPATP